MQQGRQTKNDKRYEFLTEYAAHHSDELILRCFSSGEEFLEKYRLCMDKRSNYRGKEKDPFIC